MLIGVPREIASGERRVALVPEVVPQLSRVGHRVVIEHDAGLRAGFTDDAYGSAGCDIVDSAHDVYSTAQMLLKVQRPGREESSGEAELDMLREGTVLIGLLQPSGDPALFQQLAERKIIACSMELVPRTTRAQMMDALSSQSTVAGYKAVLLAANALQKFFPMLMTAAGTVRPARVLVIGAGVAGLQAIATARRIGAVVEAFDTRPAVKEQVKSLGATFVELDVHLEDAQDAGGYAKELSERHIRREKELIHNRALQADVIITTALVPGKPAPMLVSAETVRAMRPGSVIVDLAGEQGGNCELSVPGETVVRYDVTIIAPLHISSDLAFHASQMYAKNVAALVTLLAPKGELNLNFKDDIIDAVVITTNGEVRHEPTRRRLGMSPLKTAEVAR
ncbi:MAG: Re/Si-specific NAD(P)(+) transhydrogenase subunit alpha [Gemmatimonadetes bacterium]|nr:MAG: Re/Si-specific NAD(P)(+) transhydrogenase subunit alpha [Gemmatimonadota bacterium]PYP54278.1 MAG: Re/Si-specific NAD(P)(+) transhydrogenase subunit alpha [Gemmatimonadota bacterium]